MVFPDPEIAMVFGTSRPNVMGVWGGISQELHQDMGLEKKY